MEEEGLGLNVGETRALCIGEKTQTRACVNELCSLWGGGVGGGLIQCRKCLNRVHKRFAKIEEGLFNVEDFECGLSQGHLIDKDCQRDVFLTGNEIERVESFCYLGES